MTTPTPKFKVFKESSTIVKNIVLEGVEILKAEKITTTFDVKYELHPKTNHPFKIVSKNQVDQIIEHISLPLVEVTPEELVEYRKNGIASFVLKVDDKLYYTKIPDYMSFFSSNIFGTHRCSMVGHECNRLSAASDQHGGCAKVRHRSQHIERYPWITMGYETFNTKYESFIVVKCLHYQKIPTRKKLSSVEINNTRLSLAEFVCDTNLKR